MFQLYNSPFVWICWGCDWSCVLYSQLFFIAIQCHFTLREGISFMIPLQGQVVSRCFNRAIWWSPIRREDLFQSGCSVWYWAIVHSNVNWPEGIPLYASIFCPLFSWEMRFETMECWPELYPTLGDTRRKSWSHNYSQLAGVTWSLLHCGLLYIVYHPLPTGRDAFLGTPAAFEWLNHPSPQWGEIVVRPALGLSGKSENRVFY